MRVSKNQVTLLSAAVAALFAVGANAQNLTLPNNSVTPVVAGTVGKVFAREYIAGTQLSTTGVSVNTVLGIGTSSAQNRYLRFRLSNATFNSAPVAGNLASVTGGNVSPTIASGGGAGSNSVIYQITTANTGANIADIINFNMPTGINVTSTAGAATLTYEVYEFLAQAQAGSPVLYTAATNLASFAPVVAFANTTTARTQTATAISSYLNVSGGNAIGATGLIAEIGNVTISTPLLAGTANFCGANLPCLADGVTNALLANVINAAGSNVVALTGDFSAAASAASVTYGGTAATSVTATGASVAMTGAQATGGAAQSIRYTVNGTTPIPVSTYTAAYTGTANLGFTLSTLGPITTGSITRDGVQLEAPWATTTPGFISRFFLTQTTPASVPYTVTVRNAAGLVTGGTLSGTLAANRQTIITLASLLPADTTAFPGPYQVTFNVAADFSATQGSYVLTTPSGTVTNTPLFRLGSQ